MRCTATGVPQPVGVLRSCLVAGTMRASRYEFSLGRSFSPPEANYFANDGDRWPINRAASRAFSRLPLSRRVTRHVVMSRLINTLVLVLIIYRGGIPSTNESWPPRSGIQSAVAWSSFAFLTCLAARGSRGSSTVVRSLSLRPREKLCDFG